MTIPSWLHAVLSFAPVRAIPRATLGAIAMYGALAVAFAIAERVLYGRSLRRYATRPVVNDYVYAIFFNGGYFTLIVYPLVKLTEALCAPLKMNVLPRMPLPLAIITFYLVADFSFYW